MTVPEETIMDCGITISNSSILDCTEVGRQGPGHVSIAIKLFVLNMVPLISEAF